MVIHLAIMSAVGRGSAGLSLGDRCHKSHAPHGESSSGLSVEANSGGVLSVEYLERNIHLVETSIWSSTRNLSMLRDINSSSCARPWIFCSARLTKRIYQERFESNIGESLPIVHTVFSSQSLANLSRAAEIPLQCLYQLIVAATNAREWP